MEDYGVRFEQDLAGIHERERESTKVYGRKRHNRTIQEETKQAKHDWIRKDRIYGIPMAIL